MEGNRIRLASDFYITRDGTPAASIVVRTGAPDKVMEAARDLQDIIRRMSGAELPICDDAFRVEGNKILLGPSGYTRIHNVVFPEPFFPSRPTRSPLLISKQSACSHNNSMP